MELEVDIVVTLIMGEERIKTVFKGKKPRKDE